MLLVIYTWKMDRFCFYLFKTHFVCTYVSAHVGSVCIYTCLCTHMWKSEVNFGYFSLPPPILVGWLVFVLKHGIPLYLSLNISAASAFIATPSDGVKDVKLST